jgi:SlyX protein
MDNNLAARLEALETRLAYQDQTIEDLNRMVTAQWARIDALGRELALLTDRVQQAEARAPVPPEPPPPHY